MSEELKKEKMTRGQFLLMGGLGSFVGAVLTIPPFVYALSPSIKVMFQGKTDVPNNVWRVVGSVFAVPAGEPGVFRVEFPQKQSYSAGQPNAKVGTITDTVLVSWKTEVKPDGSLGKVMKPEFVNKKSKKLTKSERKEAEKKLNVMSNACAHLGCPVRWSPSEHQILCPCHGGIYTINGAHVGGPPPHGLWRYIFEIREDGVIRIKHEFAQGIPWVV